MSEQFFYVERDNWVYPASYRAIARDAMTVTAEQRQAILRCIDPELLRARAWQLIQAERDAIKAGGVQVNSHWFHTDAESRVMYLGLLRKAEQARKAGVTGPLTALDQPIYWKTLAGEFVPMTADLIEAVFAAVSDLDAAAFAVAERHRQTLSVAKEPGLYDFTGGWPPIFGSEHAS